MRLDNDHDYEIGSSLTVENFKDIEMVDIISTTKGKGFRVSSRWVQEDQHLTDLCFTEEVVHMVCANGKSF